jgi:hypothetical protein
MTWDRYAQTIISVETLDGWLDLNGPEAVEKLPWDAPLHVITAWNPGEWRSQATNEKWQEALCHDLWAEGFAIHQAFGRSTEGLHAEDSVAVSGLGRDRARQIGARYGQIAIFEVNDTKVLVLHCHQDKTTVVPRLVS